MPRRVRKIQDSQPGPSNGMEVDSDSDEQVSVSQVSKSMGRINVSQNARRSRVQTRLLDSDSDEEPQEFRNTQRMNRSQKGQKGKANARRIDSDSDEEPQASRNTQRMNGYRKGGRVKANARQVDSDSNEEPQPSTSQASQKRKKKNTSQSQRNHQSLSQPSTSGAGETLFIEDIPASQISPNTSLTEQEYNHHVANVVKYILAADQLNVPIDRNGISNAVDCHNKRFKDVFKSAQEVLKNVFGYVLVDIEEENKNEPKSQSKQTKITKFIVVNTVNSQNLHTDIDEEASTKYVLLFFCLAHIFMSGSKCTADSLKAFLKKLEIVTENHVTHETFGDAMKTVQDDFTKEKYINWQGDELTWGLRAIKELKPRAVMEFISMVYDGRELESWRQEYERLLAMEQEPNQRPNGQISDAAH